MKRNCASSFTFSLAPFLALLLAPQPAAAIEFRAGQDVVVGLDEVIFDDLYAAGETVVVDGTVEGDLVATGREVTLNGRVTGDLIAAAQAVVVHGEVEDDVRIAGMALLLGPSAVVGDDVVAAGFSLESAAGGSTGGALLFSGFQALVAGDVGGGLRGSMAALEIRGRIRGDSEVEVEGDPGTPAFAQFLPSPVPLPAVAGGLTIGEEARIEGRLEYVSANEARGPGTASANLARREPSARPVEAGEAARRSPWPGRLFKWLGLIVLGLLLVWWTPGWLGRRSAEIDGRPLAMAGLGLVGVAALPVGILLAVVALAFVAALLGLVKLGNLAALTLVVGLAAVGLLVLLFWLSSAYLAPVLVGLCAGRWALSRVAADRARGLVLPVVVGLVLLALLRFVPFLGFLVAVAILLLGWGTILVWLWQRLRRPSAGAST